MKLLEPESSGPNLYRASMSRVSSVLQTQKVLLSSSRTSGLVHHHEVVFSGSSIRNHPDKRCQIVLLVLGLVLVLNH